MNDFGMPAEEVPLEDPKTGRVSVAWRGYFTKINGFLQTCVTGPIVATDGAPALFDGPTGKQIKE